MRDDWKSLVRKAACRLEAEGIDSPYAEAERLWCGLSGVDLTTWVLHPGWVGEDLVHNYQEAVNRRVAREPFHYIIGMREFMGLNFRVDSRVLIPRPETEHLVERVLGDTADTDLSLIDVGTGSGAICVSLAYYGSPLWHITATDISQDALDVANHNAASVLKHKQVHFIVSDLLNAVPESIDIVVANLPYVANHHSLELDPEVAYEPRIALYADDQGLATIKRLIRQLPGKLAGRGRVYLEVGIGQAEDVERLLREQHLTILPRTRDLAGIDRVVAAEKTP